MAQRTLQRLNILACGPGLDPCLAPFLNSTLWLLKGNSEVCKQLKSPLYKFGLDPLNMVHDAMKSRAACQREQQNSEPAKCSLLLQYPPDA